MAPELITSGAGLSTSVPSMMAVHEVGSGVDIGAICSSIFSSYYESTGVAGMQSESMTVIPSMVEPQPKPLVVKKPSKMQPGMSNTARYGSSETQIFLVLRSSRSLCSQD